MPLSEPTRDLTLMTAGTARVALHQLTPKPYAVERIAALPNLGRFLATLGEVDLVWLSDGVDAGRGAAFVTELARTLGERPLTIYGAGTPPALALAGAENAAARMTVKVLRARPGGSGPGIVRALDQKGAPLGEVNYQFAAEARDTTANFDLPVELRNDIARLEIVGERSAGAVQLLDRRWRRRAIGIVSGASADTAQPCSPRPST